MAQDQNKGPIHLDVTDESKCASWRRWARRGMQKLKLQGRDMKALGSELQCMLVPDSQAWDVIKDLEAGIIRQDDGADRIWELLDYK